VTSLVSFPIVMKLVIRLSQLMLPAAPARSSSSDLQPEASTSSNFHLHTLNLQCSLNPPEQMLRYWRTPDHPNPEYEAFSTFRDDLRTAVAPFAPLALMPSTPRMLRFPQGTASRQADTIELFLTNSHAKRPLIWLAPSIKPEGKQWMPSSSMMDMQNWTHAALALDPDEKATRRIAYRDDKRRVSLETGVQICWVPDSEGEKAGAEIKLLVTVDVYLDMAVIYDPLPDTGKDMLGLILHSLIPAPPTAKTRSESEARASALRHFLACLRPAPHLHSDSQAASLQPKEMVSRLLPFQARTVAVLLQREGSSIRDVKPTTSADPTGFWNIHDFGKSFGRVAYRRVTGDMLHIGPSRAVQVTRKGKGKASDQAQRRSQEEMDELEQKLLPTVLDLSGVKGTMLCEEMGKPHSCLLSDSHVPQAWARPSKQSP